ncbi:MAG: prepilin-type N-terminal cleavage/methylation domain-containing protein [Gemmataceae bacterium]|nr:prepilin-type N-terminal cleavage/methylation domain-containing protein [Gemmataceae bacterium]MCS7271344.1 prepilin-type N-terminal cleavage/methylation domain-containing protein [Gemmataceae bacterium]MDW8243451.1 prepilin-type N-terminal cleavage/methylation domain-containing protein [Thermogemmata sp.]
MQQRWQAYTLLELLVVLAVLLIVGLAVSLTLEGNYADTRQKAAADLLRARIADARSKAMERGQWFRVAISSDGTRVRVAPDTPEFAAYSADDPPVFTAAVTEDRLDKATLAVVSTGDSEQVQDGEWITVATLKPDGTCKEDQVLVEVREGNNAPIYVRIRGITGTAAIIRTPTGSGTTGMRP